MKKYTVYAVVTRSILSTYIVKINAPGMHFEKQIIYLALLQPLLEYLCRDIVRSRDPAIF